MNPLLETSDAPLSPYPSPIPYGKQLIDQDDIAAVIKALKQPFITQGPTIQNFEAEMAKYTGAPATIAVSSGTAALHLACLALELGQGDWLWTSPISFVASANAGLYTGAQVDFVDIDPITRNISVSALEEKLLTAKKVNRLPKVLVVVHFAGLPAPMKAIKNLADKYGFMIIEDACHALGGQQNSQMIGSNPLSDATTFSFHPVKSMTTGEGGMICFNDIKRAARCKQLVSHGITRNADQMIGNSDGPWYYEQIELGFNYRMTDFQAALGISQLKKLDQHIQQRNNIAKRYDEMLKPLPVKTMARVNDKNNSICAYHIYPIEIDPKSSLNRRQVYERLVGLNINVNVHYIPIHLQPYYRQMGFKRGDFPNAELYYDHCITLPIFPTLDQNQQTFIITALESIL